MRSYSAEARSVADRGVFKLVKGRLGYLAEACWCRYKGKHTEEACSGVRLDWERLDWVRLEHNLTKHSLT